MAELLGFRNRAPDYALYLAQHGAFAPIGRLRIDTANTACNQLHGRSHTHLQSSHQTSGWSQTLGEHLHPVKGLWISIPDGFRLPPNGLQAVKMLRE